jgi:hypothetical protein
MLARALSNHLKEIAWAFFLISLFLVCLFVVFGRELGFDSVLWVCLGFAAILLGLFGMLLLGELLRVGIAKMLGDFPQKRIDPAMLAEGLTQSDKRPVCLPLTPSTRGFRAGPIRSVR